MKLKPIGLLLKLLPALGAALTTTVESLAKDSDGGKKITKAEFEGILSAATAKLKTVLADELTKALGDRLVP
jgi:hypothetical protein